MDSFLHGHLVFTRERELMTKFLMLGIFIVRGFPTKKMHR